jgi:hypothetical protein
MNKVIYHLHYICIASSLLKNKFGYKLFAINLYFNSTQYYPTLEKTLIMKLTLHLIFLIIRLYSCNIKPHLVILHFVNKCDGIVISKHHEWMKCTSKCFKDNNKASNFFSIVDYIFWSFSKFKEKIAIWQIYVIFTFLEQNCTNTCITTILC